MNTRKLFNLVMALIFAFSLVGNPTSAAAQEPDKSFSVWMPNSVHGYQWALGTPVTLSITHGVIPFPYYTDTKSPGVAPWDANSTWVVFDLPSSLQIQVGDLVIMSDGTTMKLLEVTNATITYADPVNDRVTGTADPNVEVQVDVQDALGQYQNVSRYVTSDPNGNWSADFSIPGSRPDEQIIFDIVAESYGFINQMDADGDNTTYRWQVSNPVIVAFPARNEYETGSLGGDDWPRGIDVTMTIDDPNTPQTVDYTDIAQPGDRPWSPNGTWTEFDLHNFTLQSGYVVTYANGYTTKTVAVTGLHITNIDVEHDTISGIDTPGMQLDVWADVPQGRSSRSVTVNQDGTWLVDFSVSGTDGQFAVDIRPGTNGQAKDYDDEWDSTQIGWNAISPVIWAHPNDSWEDWIDARDWNFGETLQLMIDNDTDPSNGILYTDSGVVGPASWNPSVAIKEFHLRGFDLRPGQIVTVTSPTTTKTLVITDLNVTDINVDLDTISGTASAGSAVQTWFHEEHTCDTEVYANETGTWIVDFTPCDVRPAIGGGVGQKDVDDDSTVYFWRVSDPSIKVWLGSNTIDGYDWKPNTLVHVSIGDYSDAQFSDQGGNLQFRPSDKNFQVTPGQLVSMTDGENTRAHTILNISVLDADIDTDVVTGTAAPNSAINVCMRVNGCNMRHVTADGDGNWSANYAIPGQQSDEGQVWDIKLGDSLDAAQYDNAGNGTGDDFWLPNPVIDARENDNRVEGWGWKLGATATVEIDDPATPQNPDISKTGTVYIPDWDPNQSYFNVDFQDEYNIKPGDKLTVNDGTFTKKHTVRHLTFTDVDLDTDMVYGTADAGQQVKIWTCWQSDPCISREETADQNGNWSTSFAIPGDQDWEQETADLQAGSWIDSSINDEDGDQTMFGWSVPNPSFNVRLNDNEVHGYQWPLGTPVTLTIDDPTTPQTADYTSTQTVGVADWDANQTFVQFRPWQDDFTLEPGMIITMSDGTITKTHVITVLTVTNADTNADTVSGTAWTGSRVDVSYCNENSCVNRHETVSVGEITGTVNATQPAGQLLPPTIWGYNDAIVDYNLNPTLARDLLAEAGYPNGFTVNLWVRDVSRIYLPHAVETAEAIKDSLQDIGITANIEVMNSGEMIQRTRNGEADLYLLGWSADFDHPDNFYYYFFCQEPGSLGLSANNSICDQIRDARLESDTPTLTSLYESISQQIHDNVPLVPLSHGRTSLLFRQDVNGLTPEWYGVGTHSFLNVTHTGNEVTYAVPYTPVSLDPAPAYDGSIYTVTSQVMDTLVRTESGVPVPGLAESWDASADKLTWTFTIRSGVSFHDGTPLDAAAVLYNLERWWDPNHPYHDGAFDYFSGLFQGFKGDPNALITDMRLVGVNQVQITLREPFSPMLSTLAAPSLAIASPAAIQSGTLSTHPVGTGPFIFAGQTPDGMIHLASNTSYWAGTPSLADLYFRVIPDESARYAALKADAIQGMEVQDVGYVSMAQEDPNLQVTWLPEMNTGYLGINQAHGPLGDVRVREAIAHAIDKQTLIVQQYNTVSFGAGTWVADFAHPGNEDDEQSTWDISSGDGGNAQQCDEDGDCTQRNWQALNYTLHAVPTYPEVHGHDWPSGADITLTIDNDTDPDNGTLYTRSKNADDDPWCGYPCFDLKGVFDLQVGQYVSMSDGTVTKTVHVSTLQIDSLDIEHETLSGVADPGSDVMVNIWSQDGKARHTVADANGEWSVDFAVPGDEDFEQFTTDITYGDNGRAVQLNPDGSDDGTLEYWNMDWVAPPSVPVVFALSSSVDISIPIAAVENISVLSTLNDGLFRLDKENNIQPLAAIDYTVSSDGLAYTVTLRSGAVWSDGQPVTAQQYVDGILRILNPNAGSDYGFILFPIQNAKEFNEGSIIDPAQVGIKATSAQTLVFTLKEVTSHFLYILASPVIQPVRMDVINTYGTDWTKPAHYVGNGPYRLLEYDTAHILVEKNPLYNGPMQGNYSQIGFDVITDPGERITAYKSGSVDVLFTLPVQQILDDPDLVHASMIMPTPGVQYVGLMNQVYPTNNLLVREALAAAIDRETLVKDVLRMPWRAAATGVIPPELPGYQGSEVGYSYDPALAQSYLAQAGYPNGAGFPPLKLIAVEGNRATLEEIVRQWETVLGITVQVDYVPAEERFGIMTDCRTTPASCQYNAYLLGWLIDYPDAYNMLNDLFRPDSPYNYIQWESSTYLQSLQQAVSEGNLTQRVHYMQEAEQELVTEQAAVIPLFYLDYPMVVRPGVYPYYSPSYFTNLAYWSNMDPVGDGMTADVIGPDGGTIAAENNTISIQVPVNALPQDVTLSVTDLGGNYQLADEQTQYSVLYGYNIQPHGLQFNEPITLTFYWKDDNNDGIVDETGQSEADIRLFKDGVSMTPPCSENPDCSMGNDRLTYQVTSLSRFELVVPVDSTLPVITPIIAGTLGNNGWYTSPVTVSWNVNDPESGISSTDGCSATVLAEDAAGITLTCSAANGVGLVQSASVTVKIDTTVPIIQWTGSIQDGDGYSFNFVPPIPTCTAVDALSGISTPCTISGYATTIGTHTLTATATDNAGNQTHESRVYTVSIWTLKGFYQPVDMNGVYNIVKGGSTVPLKFEVFAGDTELTDVGSVKNLTFAETSCTANAVTDEIEYTVTADAGLRYDPVSGQFIYNWKTTKDAGKCYRVTVATQDGSSRWAYFKLK